MNNIRDSEEGSEVEPTEVGEAYDTAVLLAREGGDARRIAAVVERYPHAGFPVFPRERALAQLAELGHDDEGAVLRVRAALATGAIDVDLSMIELRALVRLGRTDEADEARAAVRTLQPSALEERVNSGLLRR